MSKLYGLRMDHKRVALRRANWSCSARLCPPTGKRLLCPRMLGRMILIPRRRTESAGQRQLPLDCLTEIAQLSGDGSDKLIHETRFAIGTHGKVSNQTQALLSQWSHRDPVECDPPRAGLGGGTQKSTMRQNQFGCLLGTHDRVYIQSSNPLVRGYKLDPYGPENEGPYPKRDAHDV
jgi:hypothetical protein